MNELWTDLQRCYGAMRWGRPELALGISFAPPLLLTQRKSDKFKVVLSPEDAPTPPPARPVYFGPSPRLARRRQGWVRYGP
jgi:hypothetical protein